MNYKNKPFWQILTLTAVTSVTSGLVSYWNASDDGKIAAAQTWATTQTLLDSHEARLRRIEDSLPLVRPAPMPAPISGTRDMDLGDLDEELEGSASGSTSQSDAKLLPMSDKRVKKARELY